MLPFQDHRDDSEDAILRATDAMAAFTQDALNFTATQDSDGSTTAECQGVSTEDWASECSTDSGGPSPWRCIGADASAGPASSLLLDEELKRHEQDPPRAKSCECCGQQTPHELLERRPAEVPRFDGSGQHTPKVLLETRPAEGPRSRELSSLDLFPKFGAPNCSPERAPLCSPSASQRTSHGVMIGHGCPGLLSEVLAYDEGCWEEASVEPSSNEACRAAVTQVPVPCSRDSAMQLEACRSNTPVGFRSMGSCPPLCGLGPEPRPCGWEDFPLITPTKCNRLSFTCGARDDLRLRCGQDAPKWRRISHRGKGCGQAENDL